MLCYGLCPHEKCRCGRNTLWLEIEGRTDDVLEFDKGIRVAPMSLYKVLEEVKAIRRFQLIQRASDKVELRLVADEREEAFEQAKRALREFFESKGLTTEIFLSDRPPQADRTSGKFKHIYSTYTKTSPKQKQALALFRERGAISKARHDKSLRDLTEKGPGRGEA